MGCCWCKPDVLTPPNGAHDRTFFVGKVGPYRSGDRVAAQYWSGGWYAATIEKENGDGTFLLSWDDGDAVDRVKHPDRLRRLEVSFFSDIDPRLVGGSFRGRKVTIVVERSRLLQSAMGPVLAAGPEELRPGVLRVQYRGEEGEDGEGGGGITRAFLANAGSLINDARLGLLLPAPCGHLQLSPLAGFLTPNATEMESVHQQPDRWSRFFGRLLGMSVAHECPLGLLLAPPLCKQLLGQDPSFEDLQFVPGLSEDGAGWYCSLRALLVHRTSGLVQDDPTLAKLDADTVDEALRGLEAAMPSKAEQVFQSLAAHVGNSASVPQRWEEAAEIATCLLQEAATQAQRDLAAARARELVETIAATYSSNKLEDWQQVAAGVCIHPSDEEPLGTVFCEGMTNEMPEGLRCALCALWVACRILGSQCGQQGRTLERFLQRTLGDECADAAFELEQVAAEWRRGDPPVKGPCHGQALLSQALPHLGRALSHVQGPGVHGGEDLTAVNLQAFAEAVAAKALTENLQPHLGLIVEEFTRVVPVRMQQNLTWQQVRDRLSGKRLDPVEFVREWRDRTTYQSCSEADESVRLWWTYVSERTAEELARLFSWCTGFAAIPVTAWKFQIKVVDDVVRCPSINTCMTDDNSAANRGVKMPTIYLPAYDSQATLAQKMDWAIAGATSMNLH